MQSILRRYRDAVEDAKNYQTGDMKTRTVYAITAVAHAIAALAVAVEGNSKDKRRKKHKK